MCIRDSGDSVQIRARALAAAGSDARMSGCELPVIINSGSGNQGMTCSLPVIAYARELQSSEEQLYRALLLSLIHIYGEEFKAFSFLFSEVAHLIIISFFFYKEFRMFSLTDAVKKSILYMELD